MPNQTETTVVTNEAEAEGFISKEVLLQRLPISSGTLNNWMKNQKIPFVKIHRRVLFDWPSVRQSLLHRQRGVAS